MSKELGGLVKQLGRLLARTEAGLAAAHALDDALIERADEVDAARLKDMERCRAMLDAETDPAKVREIERQYLAAAVDRNRDRRAARAQAEARRGRPMIRP
jgi:hypothetical protein